MRLVVENVRVGFDRLGREGIESPRRGIQNCAHTVERQGHIGAVAIGYQTLRSIDQPLAADSERQRSVGAEWTHHEIDKDLREIELILIDLCARALDPGVFPSAHQLRENTDVLSQVEITKEEIALQQESAGTLGLLSPKRVVKVL